MISEIIGGGGFFLNAQNKDPKKLKGILIKIPKTVAMFSLNMPSPRKDFKVTAATKLMLIEII
jgi:hypothetical protein